MDFTEAIMVLVPWIRIGMLNQDVVVTVPVSPFIKCLTHLTCWIFRLDLPNTVAEGRHAYARTMEPDRIQLTLS